MNNTQVNRHEKQAEKYYGKYAGIRLGNDLSEPDGAVLRGEILVKVPGILEENPEDEGQRPFQAWAKPCFPPGFFMIPDVKSNVWVEFVAGDINFPIWSGAWYPNDKQPKTTDDKAPTEDQKIISTKSGHIIQIDDSEEKELVNIFHKSGSRINFDEKGGLLIANKKGSFVFLNAAESGELTLAEEHGNLITLKEDGVLIANKDSQITLELKEGKLTILSADSVNIMTSKINMEAGTINLGGSLATESTVLGKALLAQFNTHVHPTSLGPSGPPLVPLTPMVISKQVKVMP